MGSVLQAGVVRIILADQANRPASSGNTISENLDLGKFGWTLSRALSGYIQPRNTTSPTPRNCRDRPGRPRHVGSAPDCCCVPSSHRLPRSAPWLRTDTVIISKISETCVYAYGDKPIRYRINGRAKKLLHPIISVFNPFMVTINCNFYNDLCILAAKIEALNLSDGILKNEQ